MTFFDHIMFGSLFKYVTDELKVKSCSIIIQKSNDKIEFKTSLKGGIKNTIAQCEEFEKMTKQRNIELGFSVTKMPKLSKKLKDIDIQ